MKCFLIVSLKKKKKKILAKLTNTELQSNIADIKQEFYAIINFHTHTKSQFVYS